MRTIFLLACLMSTIAFTAPAHAAWWHFLFPSLKKAEYNPYETLQAPFAQDDAASPDADGTQKSEDLSQPHRNDWEIAKWIAETTPLVMRLSSSTDQDSALDFSSNGTAQFKDFLAQQNITRALESGQYELHTVVDGKPQLLNEGNVSGRYRWLYEVTVMTTYLPRNLTTYKNTKPINQNFVLNIQVGRSTDAPQPHHILIEQFSGKKTK